MAKTETQEVTINGTEIIFYPNSHRYKADGAWVPSVTTVLGLIDKSRQLLKWSENLTRDFLNQYLNIPLESNVIESAVTQYSTIRDTAADIGHQIHEWIEKFVSAKMNNTDTPQVDSTMEQAVINGIMAFLQWYNENEVIFLESERIVYSKEHNYIGTFDVLMKVNGINTLADFKSGKGVYAPFWYQLSAYKQAYQEEYPDSVIQQYMILHFDKETGDFQCLTKDVEEISVEHFNALLKLKTDIARLESKKKETANA